MKNALNYGLITGIALVIVSLVLWMFGTADDWIESLITYATLTVGIVIGIKTHRDKNRNGLITYGYSLGMGTLISLFASIILAIYLYTFLKYIDPDVIGTLLDIEESKLEDADLSQKDIEMSMNIVRKIIVPFWMSIISVMVYTFVGFIISLIASIFLKKTDDSFDANFQ